MIVRHDVDVLIVTVLTLHLLCMHVASAAPLVSGWFAWRCRRGNVGIHAMEAKWLASASLFAVFLGSVFGLILGYLLFAFRGHDYSAVLERLPTKIYWGAWELVFYVVCMTACVFSWRIGHDRPRLRAAFHVVVAILAGTNLLYHFPTLFVIASRIAIEPGDYTKTIGAGEFREIMFSPEPLAQTVHFAGAAFAVTGVLVVARASSFARQADDRWKYLAKVGARIALPALLWQFLTGVWVVTALPRVVQSQLLGNGVLAAVMLASSIVLFLAVSHALATISFGYADRRSLRRVVVLTLLAVLMMTGTKRSLDRLSEPTTSAVSLSEDGS